ncbi:MAG TPA: MFS transporter [Bauldia sp.]|nr:MFS transporter [Bauldia sp.]
MPTAPTAVTAAPQHYVLRMWLFYAGYFIFGGISTPFFPVWLQARGLSEIEIAQVIALPQLIRVFITPLAGIYADRAPNRRFATISILVPAAVLFLAAYPAHSFWALLIATGIPMTLYGMALPPVEALALTGVRRFGLDYGRMRMGGSVAFIFANLGSGALLGIFAAENIYFFLLVAMFLSVAIAFILPVTPPAIRALDDVSKPDARSSREVLGNVAFLVVLLSVGAIQGSHAILYSFGSIEWHSLGYASFQIGAFWAFSLACEISVFAFARRLVAWLGAHNLLLVGAGATVVRWILFPLVPPLGFAGFAFTMALHGLTFGATYLGAQQTIARMIPEKMTASAQGIFAMIGGVSMAIATSLAGPIYHALGIDGFFVMAPVAALAFVALLLVKRRALAG